jgi:glycosyltransferase involved in cell wall biosynthesis
MNITVVIIAKNEAYSIANTLQSLKGLTDDIIIVDSGSTDETVNICKQFMATIIETNWEGYGLTKNKGAAAAKYDWILSLDADEAIDEKLKQSLRRLSLKDENEVFKITRRNFFCNKLIRFGEWGQDTPIRLFNRKKAAWNNAAVHENLVFPEDVTVIKLKGNILHYTVQNRREYDAKTDEYARMNAGKYVEAGKRANFFKQYFSPVFAFIQHYIFRLGFLDGKEGFIIAKTTARYTFLKYHYLKEMKKNAAIEN